MPQINISAKEVKKLRCLGTTLNSGMIPVNDIRSFLESLEQKISAPANRVSKKLDRKEKFRLKILNGGKKQSA